MKLVEKAFSGRTENQLLPLRALLKSSGIYALASMAPPLVSLVLAPFLTHHLSPANYGILTIMNSIITLGTGITQLGLYSAFFRAYNYDYTTEHDQRDVVTTVTTLLCLISIPVTGAIILLAPLLASLTLGNASLERLISLCAVIILLQNLTVPGYSWLRAKNRAFLFSLLSVGSLLVTLVTNIVLVGVFNLGLVGTLCATACGYASVLLCTLPPIFWRAGFKLRLDMTRSMLAFGLPLVLNFISYWILQLSDRYLLGIFGSLAQTAVYAVPII
jgi:O-antigen/teichoic acid export membrane protein